jgi:hypothetical protein
VHENSKGASVSCLVLVYQSLRPTNKYGGPSNSFFFEHVHVPRIFKPHEIIALCRWDALAKAGQAIKHLRAVLLAINTSFSWPSVAEIVQRERLHGALGLQRLLRV